MLRTTGSNPPHSKISECQRRLLWNSIVTKKNRFQQKFIDRVGEIKALAGKVVERANDAQKKGDTATAQLYLESVNRLGRQLLDADVVIVFQQTGKALAGIKLSE